MYVVYKAAGISYQDESVLSAADVLAEVCNVHTLFLQG